MKVVILFVSHALAVAVGFALGIYALPILIKPDAPTAAAVQAVSSGARYTGQFRRDLAGSDLLHWGEGTVAIASDAISLMGRLAPGPDYKLYLAPAFVQTEEEFMRVKAQSARVGDVKTFENFIVPVPATVDPARYDTIVIWCETFSQFITAAKYR